MHKALALLGAMLVFAAAAAAQDSPDAASSATPAPGTSLSLFAPSATPGPGSGSSRSGPFDNYSLQLSFGYSFVRFNKYVSGQSVSLNGINTSLAYFVSESLGIEAEATPAFGSTGGVGSKFLFYGAGVRFAKRSGREFEPWAHALLGGARFFPQTASSIGSVAYEAGGGVDWRAYQQFSFRVQADWVGTRFFKTNQNTIKIAAGIVINF